MDPAQAPRKKRSWLCGMTFRKTSYYWKKMSKTRRLPEGQDWLISKLKQAKLQADDDGVCHGVNGVAVQAILLKKIKAKFDDYLYTIHQEKRLQSRIQIAEEKRKDHKILTRNDQRLLDIPNFMQSIELYYDHVRYSHLFTEEEKPSCQDTLQVARLIIPKELEEKGGIARACFFTGIYNIDDVEVYLNSLSEVIKEQCSTFAFAIQQDSRSHTSTFTYINEWILLDAHNLPSLPVKSDKKMAKLVFEAFTDDPADKFIGINTKIYVCGEDYTAAVAFFNQWKKSDKFKMIHQYTQERLTRVGNEHASWLFIASAENDINTAKALVKNGMEINLLSENAPLPLHIAVVRNHIGVVRLLLNYGADPNLISKQGQTAVYKAARLGYHETLSLLLSHEADPNVGDVNHGVTPIFIASKMNNIRVVDVLLKYNADTTLPCFYKIDHEELKDNESKTSSLTKMINDLKINRKVKGVYITPYEVAMINGNNEIASMLKAAENKSVSKKRKSPEGDTHRLFSIKKRKISRECVSENEKCLP